MSQSVMTLSRGRDKDAAQIRGEGLPAMLSIQITGN
jgi:hypothetical protein